MLIGLFLLYCAAVYGFWGLLYASFCDEGTPDRGDSAGCLGIALLPPFWFVGPFLTGFYSAGWRNPLDWVTHRK